MRKFLIVLLFLPGTIIQKVNAQLVIKDSTLRTFMIGAAVGGDITGGDLAKRFGPGITVGGFVSYKTRTNWIFSLEYAYMYGEIIRENTILNSISANDAKGRYLINGNGEYQVMHVYESGNLVFAKVGKVLPILAHNPNSGITVKAGVGFMEHKIFYYWVGDGPPQLNGNYIKGYDRLTYGPAICQSIGYHYMGNSGRVNFTIDLEAMEGFTYDQRPYDFDLMKWSNQLRYDILYCLKFGWYFPIYGKHSKRAQYYY